MFSISVWKQAHVLSTVVSGKSVSGTLSAARTCLLDFNAEVRSFLARPHASHATPFVESASPSKTQSVGIP